VLKVGNEADLPTQGKLQGIIDWKGSKQHVDLLTTKERLQSSPIAVKGQGIPINVQTLLREKPSVENRPKKVEIVIRSAAAKLIKYALQKRGNPPSMLLDNVTNLYANAHGNCKSLNNLAGAIEYSSDGQTSDLSSCACNDAMSGAVV